MNPLPRHILRKLLSEYGPTLLNEPERVDAFLADLCGEYRRERYLIGSGDALERVPADFAVPAAGRRNYWAEALPTIARAIRSFGRGGAVGDRKLGHCPGCRGIAL